MYSLLSLSLYLSLFSTNLLFSILLVVVLAILSVSQGLQSNMSFIVMSPVLEVVLACGGVYQTDSLGILLLLSPSSLSLAVTSSRKKPQGTIALCLPSSQQM